MTDLETIMRDRPETHDDNQPEQVQVAPEQAPEGQARDENGRFAGQQQPPEPPAAQPEAGKPPEGYLPIQALDARLSKQQEKYEAQLNELRSQSEAFQRQLAAFQQQPPKPAEPLKVPDIFEDPNAAIDHRVRQMLDPVQQSQTSIVENFSRMMASDKFGEEAVNAALADMTSRVNANPAAMRFEYQRIMAAPHPYGELVKWHKNQTALSTYGDDPTAYREKLRAEIMAEMQQGQQQQQQTPPVDPNSLPTSFNRNSGPSTTPQWGGPRPLSDLMGR